MSVDNAREELRKLDRRREEVANTVRDKMRERRNILEDRRAKQKRTPENEKRERELDQEIRVLHDEAQELRTRIRDLRKRHHELDDKVDDAEKHLEQERKEKRERNQGGANAAVKWAHNQVGEHESPPGTNWGEPVQIWIQHAGYNGPVPWCGCFAHEAVVEQGAANVTTQLGYAPNITNDARANRNGLRAIPASEAKAGDIGALWNGEHVVVLRGPVSGTSVPTVEGNTSATDGSQTNGGEVAEKTRLVSDFDVFARPDY